MTRSRLLRILLVAGLGIALAAGAFVAWWAVQPERVATSTGNSGTALVGGPFELTDHLGARRSDSDFRGRYMLIYFGYTYCPDICPTTLTIMTQALDLLAEEAPGKVAQITPILITIDPERDTVEALADYVSHFHPDLVALTGTTEEIAQTAKVYRVYYKKVESESAADYLVDHSSIVYLMGPDGSYLTHFGHNADAAEIAETLGAYVNP